MRNLLLLIAMHSVSQAAEPMGGPVFITAMGSECSRLAEDALVPLGIQAAVLASEQELGRASAVTVAQKEAQLENFRSAAVLCRLKEDDLELAMSQPGGNADAAKAESDAALKSLQQTITSILAEAIITDQDRVIDQELARALQSAMLRWRQGEKYLGESDRFRTAMRNVLQSALHASIDCRIQAKRGSNNSNCLANLYAELNRSLGKFFAAAGKYRPQYASFRSEHDSYLQQKQSTMAELIGLQQKVQQLTGVIAQMETDINQRKALSKNARGVSIYNASLVPGLQEQARQMDAARNWYNYLGQTQLQVANSYQNSANALMAQYYWAYGVVGTMRAGWNFGGGAYYYALASYYYSAACWYSWVAGYYRQAAMGYFATYGAYDHAYQTIVNSLLPMVQALARDYGKWANELDADIMTRMHQQDLAKAEMASAGNRLSQLQNVMQDLTNKIQIVRSRIVGTCVDTDRFTFPGAPRCASVSGTEL